MDKINDVVVNEDLFPPRYEWTDPVTEESSQLTATTTLRSPDYSFNRLRSFIVSLVCIALGFFIGRESVRSNWLKSDVAKPKVKVIIVNPDHVDPPPNGNPFNLPLAPNPPAE